MFQQSLNITQHHRQVEKKEKKYIISYLQQIQGKVSDIAKQNQRCECDGLKKQLLEKITFIERKIAIIDKKTKLSMCVHVLSRSVYLIFVVSSQVKY